MSDYVLYGDHYDFKKAVEYIAEDKNEDLFKKSLNYDSFEALKHEALNTCSKINSWDDLIKFIELCRDKSRDCYSPEFSRLCDLYVIINSTNKLRGINTGLDSKNFKSTMSILDSNRYSDFITSPASSKYHGAYLGGLFDHSIGVYEAALRCAEIYGLRKENIDVIACIFHDLCKVGSYEFVNRVEFKHKNDRKSIAHGSESLVRLLKLDIHLPLSWELAINYHMGAFNDSRDEVNAFSRITEVHPEVLLLHHADMIATKIYGV